MRIARCAGLGEPQSVGGEYQAWRKDHKAVEKQFATM